MTVNNIYFNIRSFSILVSFIEIFMLVAGGGKRKARGGDELQICQNIAEKESKIRQTIAEKRLKLGQKVLKCYKIDMLVRSKLSTRENH